jgi:hypothetical protein
VNGRGAHDHLVKVGLLDVEVNELGEQPVEGIAYSPWHARVHACGVLGWYCGLSAFVSGGREARPNVNHGKWCHVQLLLSHVAAKFIKKGYKKKKGCPSLFIFLCFP